eukprot:3473405-Lingulodinium_polyedra.AAC.1
MPVPAGAPRPLGPGAAVVEAAPPPAGHAPVAEEATDAQMRDPETTPAATREQGELGWATLDA